MAWNKLNTSGIVRSCLLIVLPLSLFTLFSGLSNPVWLGPRVDVRLVLVCLLAILLILPILVSRFIYTTLRSRFEFSVMSGLTTLILTSSYIQINNSTQTGTTLGILSGLGVELNLSLGLGLIILLGIYILIHFDLLFGKYISEFRIRFSTAFILQIILSLSCYSFLFFRDVSNISDLYYKSVWVENLVNMPSWVIVLVFTLLSSLITIYYFGRGNILTKPRPNWAKVSWRLLILLIHFQIIGMISLLPQSYWWKVLLFILAWDFIVLPLGRIYKQKTDFFWEKLRLSLIYHTTLFLILFLISPK